MEGILGPPSFALYYKLLAGLAVVLTMTYFIAPEDAKVHLIAMLVLTALLGAAIR